MNSRAVVLEEFDHPLAVRDLPVQAPAPGEAVVDVTLGGVCGTDVHLHAGKLVIPRPVVMGHEGVGVIRELGEGLQTDATGRRLEAGSRVMWGSNIPCGSCRQCVYRQERSLCAQRRVYGINQRADEAPYLSGSWSETIHLQPKSTILLLEDEVSDEMAISLGCAGPTVVHGLLYRTGVQPGSRVVVQGSGPVGMAAAMFARLAGAGHVTMIGYPADRLRYALENRIADDVIDVSELGPEERIQTVLDATPESEGADLVVECTGVPSAVDEGMRMTRRGGKYLVLGQYTDHGPTPLNPHLITQRQLQMIGSWAFAERHVIDYVAALPRLNAQFDLAAMVTTYALEDANQALVDISEGKVVKAALAPLHRKAQ